MTRRVLLIATLLASLAGCGFHLRGSEPLPQVMERSFISATPGSQLRYELQRLLLAAGAEVVDEAASATSLLVVEKAEIRSRTLSLDTQGRAREYGLTLLVKYHLADPGGEPLTATLSGRVDRDLRIDPDSVLAQGAEREQLEQEMYRVGAEHMMRRLRRVPLTAPAP